MIAFLLLAVSSIFVDTVLLLLLLQRLIAQQQQCWLLQQWLQRRRRRSLQVAAVTMLLVTSTYVANAATAFQPSLLLSPLLKKSSKSHEPVIMMDLWCCCWCYYGNNNFRNERRRTRQRTYHRRTSLYGRAKAGIQHTTTTTASAAAKDEYYHGDADRTTTTPTKSSATSSSSQHRTPRQRWKVDRSKVLDVATQLQYARNGHAVLRQLLIQQQQQQQHSSKRDTRGSTRPKPTIITTQKSQQQQQNHFLLSDLRETLVQYGIQNELSAWRQKIVVALDQQVSPKIANDIAMACTTLPQCQKELARILRDQKNGSHRSSSPNKEEDDTLPPPPIPFLQYFNTWRNLPQVRDLAYQLAESAAIFMDVPSVRLYQDSVFWKHAHTHGPTPWHVDAKMAPFDTSHMITFWIPLQPISIESGGGALIFCSKSHADFALPYWNELPTMSSSSSSSATSTVSPWNNLEERYSDPNNYVDYMPLALGDVTVHSGWTLHCADAYTGSSSLSRNQNSSISKNHNNDNNDEQSKRNSRMALAITYVDARAPIRSDISNKKSDPEDLWSYQDWVHDVPTMTYADWTHPLVPIVWPPPSTRSSSSSQPPTTTKRKITRRPSKQRKTEH